MFQQHVVIVTEVMITLVSQDTTVTTITLATLLYHILPYLVILVDIVAVEDPVQCVCHRVKHATC